MALASLGARSVSHTQRHKAEAEPEQSVGPSMGPSMGESNAEMQELLRNPGRPLPEAVRAKMEAVLGCDLGHVRIHTDPKAASAAEQLHAHAFALGADLWFGEGEWAPGTSAGDQLLAHELTHVVQHSEGGQPASGGLSSPTEPAEREAYAAERSAQAPAAEIPASGAAERARPAPPAGQTKIYRSVLSETADDYAQGGEPAEQDQEGYGFSLGSAWDWLLGVLIGDFNEDPSLSQLIVRTLVTLIPYVDTAGDIEDLVAALYKLVWEERYDEASPWFDLVVTLIGFVPEFGTAAKGILKGLKMGLGSLDLVAILKLLEGLGLGKHLDEVVSQLGDLLSGLPALAGMLSKRASEMLTGLGTKADEAVAALRKFGSALPGKLAEKATALQARLERLGKAARQAAAQAQDRVSKALDDLEVQLEYLQHALKLAIKVGPQDAAALFGAMKKASALDKLKYLENFDAPFLKKLAAQGEDVQVAFWRRSDAFHNSVQQLDPALQPKLLEQLAKKAPRPQNPSYPTKQLQHEWQHATDFGFPSAKKGNFKIKTDGPAFEAALQKHLDNSDAAVIAGTYKGEAVTHIVDLVSGNNVFYRASGEFWGCWKLGSAQLGHVITSGSLK